MIVAQAQVIELEERLQQAMNVSDVVEVRYIHSLPPNSCL
jgi:hypothetical protein